MDDVAQPRDADNLAWIRDSQPPLRRTQAAKALTEAGYQISPATLATMATRGGGPPYTIFGRVALYGWNELLAWARSRGKIHDAPPLANANN